MIDKIEPRPYLLKNSIQNYAWGTKDKDAFIPKLVGIETENDLPYAELWIGAHPKAPSKIIIDDKEIQLNELIKKFPKEILGEYVAGKFDNKLPYLLKVLSINQALSIQVHPSKALAKVLHKRDPQNYPDENHKPEIAVAVDFLQAIIGFKRFDKIKSIINDYTGLKILLGEDILKTAENAGESNKRETVKLIYSKIMRSSGEELEKAINEIKIQIENKLEPTEEEKQFLIQYEIYGIDAGLISILLFNFVKLKPGEAIFTKDGVPHAYIKGNIVECMANSDNVVRAGLTPKYKDVDTLLEMLNYEDGEPAVINDPESNIVQYKTPAEEFELVKYKFTESKTMYFDNNKTILIGICMDGNVSIYDGNNDKNYLNVEKGKSFLIPASLHEFNLAVGNNTTFYIAKVPQL